VFFVGAKGQSFTEKLDGAALKYFIEVAKRPFSQQAVAFLNAYWKEAQSEAEFIYSYVYDSPFSCSFSHIT
jgi:hypothetical protein